MPFIDNVNRRQIEQESRPYEDVYGSSFGEVFAASVGQVFDEELSISRSLNREGWQDRAAISRSILEERDDLNKSDYIDRRGRFDYNKFAIDAHDERVKTDELLEEERRNLLDMKRRYAQDVIDRGNGMAQFLGSATGYMLDPVNIATMGVGTGVSAAKSVGVAGRALMTARNTAALSIATELAIQPMVYEHKADINSPYSEQDAIQAILTATIAGGFMGAVEGGIIGYLKKVRGAVDELPETGELRQAKEQMMRVEQTLSTAPDQSAEGHARFFNELSEQKKVSGSPSRTIDQYDVPEEVLDEPDYDIVTEVTGGDTFDADLAAGRQSEILDSLGIKEDFDRDMQAFSQIDSPKAIIDGEIVDAVDVMKGFDDEIEGINSVLVCARG